MLIVTIKVHNAAVYWFCWTTTILTAKCVWARREGPLLKVLFYSSSFPKNVEGFSLLPLLYQYMELASKVEGNSFVSGLDRFYKLNTMRWAANSDGCRARSGVLSVRARVFHKALVNSPLIGCTHACPAKMWAYCCQIFREAAHPDVFFFFNFKHPGF